MRRWRKARGSSLSLGQAHSTTISNGAALPKDEPWWTKAVAIAAAVVLCIVVLPILLLALPFLAVGAWLDRRKRRRLQREFHNRWGGQGKRLLLVYSNSPNWQAYVEGNWLPQLESIAVVLNWSERSTWASGTRSRPTSSERGLGIGSSTRSRSSFRPTGQFG